MRFRFLVPLALCTSLSFFSATSSAEPTPGPTPKKEWYGWQTLVTDVAAQATGFALAKDTELTRNASPVLIVPGGPPLRATFDAIMGDGFASIEFVSLGTYLLAAPLVHLAHARPKTAVYSFGLRLGAPPAGALVGFAAGALLCAICGGEGHGSLLLGSVLGVIGGAAGYLAAIAVDAGMLAVVDAPSSTPPARSGFRIVPLPNGVGGTF